MTMQTDFVRSTGFGGISARQTESRAWEGSNVGVVLHGAKLAV